MADVRRAAVLGSPIAHSLSPVLHRAAYHVLGLADWRFDAIECDESGLDGFLRATGAEWVGLALTQPLKRVALAVADEISPLAQAVGAANTLLFAASGRKAENTDVGGIEAALRSAGVTSVSSALVLGAGGTAQAALAALRDLGLDDPTVLVRDMRRTADLAAAAERLGVHPTIVGGLLDGPLPDADVVISTLPSGAADALRLEHPSRVRLALDVVYSPWPTPFAASFTRAGVQTVGGLEVLLHQAVAQVELMSGLPAPVDAMRSALSAAETARAERARTAG